MREKRNGNKFSTIKNKKAIALLMMHTFNICKYTVNIYGFELSLNCLFLAYHSFCVILATYTVADFGTLKAYVLKNVQYILDTASSIKL